ncbi:MAG TPA: hypothetical protein VMZ30_12590 [Pyrinomonadaceae bacterium]|nr:hypothetical protein [Pyrinomonadaceae bacterium]
MATEERFILDSITGTTGTTGLGQQLRGLIRTFHILPSVSGYSILSFTLTRPRTLLETIIDDLERLERRSDYFFKPSKHAMRAAKFYIFETYALMGRAFPRPSFVLDGEKGIIIKWAKSGHTVRLNCLANESDDDYIYFENAEYDTEDNVTPEKLQNRLNWLLNQHA